MRTVRKGFFETNSSSCHSLSIDLNSFIKEDVKVNTLFAEGGEFGWEKETYNDFYTKFNYLITYLFQNVKSDNDIETIKRYNENYELLKNIIYEQLGIEISFEEFSQMKDAKWYPFGYIDHQSDDVASGAFESYEKLYSFLFNTNSLLITDNDNHD